MATNDLQVVIDCELALLSPEVRESAPATEQLLDPEFREVGASGRLWTRAASVAQLGAESSDDQPEVVVSEMAGVALTDDLVLLTYVSTEPGRRARRCSLWRRSAGSWRVLYHQATPSQT